MGNCVRKESPTEWGGEDWGPFSPVKTYDDEDEEEKLCSGKDNKDRFGKFGKEIKVKISKDQLAQLMEKANFRSLSVNQLLDELMNGADKYQTHQHRSWRPALQSIPELN